MKLNKSIRNTNTANSKEVEALMDAYKEFYLELKQAISQLRKEERYPIIPEALSRKIPSKIKFAEVTESIEDLGKVEIGLLEVQKEIEYCKKEIVVNVKKEIEEVFKKENEQKETGEEIEEATT